VEASLVASRSRGKLTARKGYGAIIYILTPDRLIVREILGRQD
jgi:hypothetical protein